jgi:hypothetical protein
MRKHLLASTAALFLLVGAAAAHADAAPAAIERSVTGTNTSCLPGMHCLPFLRGNGTPQELAQKIRASLAKDPSGNSIIDPVRCGKDGSCAAPHNYLESLRDKKKDLTLAMLADYVAGFKRIKPSAADYETDWDTDCMEPVGNGAYRSVINCMHRKPKAGEYFWVDNPLNPLNYFFEDCSNPRRGEHHEPEEVVVKLGCVEIRYVLPPHSTAFRYEVIGDHSIHLMKECPLLIQVADGPKKPPTDDCPSKNCTFREAEAAVISAINSAVITNVKNVDIRSKRASAVVPSVEQELSVTLFGPPDLKDQVTLACVDVTNPDGSVRYSNGKAVATWPGVAVTVPRFTFPAEAGTQ